ncbi:cytochrome P450 [Streptomyces sp. NPDC053741]|uniref:cytochrome P450 n=1 Tax=Streptomyces TaxID=1883 RepID=UPI0002C6AAFD|nr:MULTISPECIES: cytochrome P450 [Streptomyces]RAS27341.1 cytochrome P450 [Streptomyces avidinii]SNX80233.1 Cytochrome P450 [Streptomyces microflavus]AGJ57907.1 putative cytochrome P450 hydroxylase [Streptomyces sp. PAMC 26508]MCX4412688.1 cytochrome P450 [[Kitasatospora] papulosa]QBR09032.1 cytochrome P450 [Streptomyces sp. S501]
MTSTVRTGGAQAPSAPEFPMPRAEGCPFDPPPALKKEQEQGPLRKVRLWDGSTPWLVTRYADQRALLADPRTSADITRPGYPSSAPVRGSSFSFILMDDPEHARQRRMVTAPFTIKRVEAMRPAVQKIVDGLIDDMLAGPPRADLVQAFALPVPSLVICELLGVPYADHDFFQENSKILISRSAAPEERGAAHAKLIGYLDELMGHKIARPADDLLSGLGTRVGAGELSRREAAETGVLLLIAGHETTANMIALGTLALLEHPDQLALLRDSDDPKAVAGAVEELLRYLNITHGGRRRVAVEDIEIGGEVIRAGEGIIVPNDIGNRDPEVFADPDRLDLGRDARRHVAFGFGVHQCLGQPLARMELQVVYSTLYRRIPTLRLDAGLEDLSFKHDGAVYGVYELPVAW